jgi:hypothetical protein
MEFRCIPFRYIAFRSIPENDIPGTASDLSDHRIW